MNGDDKKRSLDMEMEAEDPMLAASNPEDVNQKRSDDMEMEAEDPTVIQESGTNPAKTGIIEDFKSRFQVNLDKARKAGEDQWSKATNPFIMGFEKTYQWDNPINSGIVFGSVLVTLISICYYSLISVVAYASLTTLLAVLSLKIYTYVMVTFLKKESTNPIAKFASYEMTIPEDKVNQMSSKATTKLNATLLELRRLFLVDNMLDSVKFGLSLWVLTYIGSWFNAMTLILMAWVGLFTVPKIYLLNKTQIDPVLEKVKAQLSEISGKVTAMIPQKAAADAKKEE